MEPSCSQYTKTRYCHATKNGAATRKHNRVAFLIRVADLARRNKESKRYELIGTEAIASSPKLSCLVAPGWGLGPRPKSAQEPGLREMNLAPLTCGLEKRGAPNRAVNSRCTLSKHISMHLFHSAGIRSIRSQDHPRHRRNHQ